MVTKKMLARRALHCSVRTETLQRMKPRELARLMQWMIKMQGTMRRRVLEYLGRLQKPSVTRPIKNTLDSKISAVHFNGEWNATEQKLQLKYAGTMHNAFCDKIWIYARAELHCFDSIDDYKAPPTSVTRVIFTEYFRLNFETLGNARANITSIIHRKIQSALLFIIRSHSQKYAGTYFSNLLINPSFSLSFLLSSSTYTSRARANWSIWTINLSRKYFERSKRNGTINPWIGNNSTNSSYNQFKFNRQWFFVRLLSKFPLLWKWQAFEVQKLVFTPINPLQMFVKN